MTLKIKGTNEGFKTEALIEEYLNNKKIVDLNFRKNLPHLRFPSRWLFLF